VGKTTTSVNLSTALAAAGYKVLLCDFDPQGNASTGLGLYRASRSRTLYHALIGQCTLSEALQKTMIPGLSVVPSSLDLLGAEVEFVNQKDREFVFKSLIEPYESMFDYIIMDCPPSMGLLTLNAMVAAQGVLVPLQCEYYALEGLSYLLKSIQKIRDRFNPRLELFGVVLTMFDGRSSLSHHVSQDVREHLKEKVFSTVIPRNVRVSEAPSHGKPVLIYDVNCLGSQAYMNLAREILQRKEAA
jgi:chromosome partitioning protein